MSEEVIDLKLPQSSVGAPIPILLSNEHHLFVAYYLQDTPKDFDGTSIKVVDGTESNEPIAIVEFPLFLTYRFGMPNDEAFSGHPLASKGLEPYGTYEVLNSSWIDYFEKINSVHPYHKKDDYKKYKHFIFSFHDTTLEVISEKFNFNTIIGSLKDARNIISKELQW